MRRFYYLLALYFLFVALLIAGLCSCSAERMNTYHCKRCKISDSTYVKNDTITSIDTITTAADSSIYEALIKCINGKPVIHTNTIVNGRKTRITVTQLDTLFIIKCNTSPEQYYKFTKSYVLREYNRRAKEFTVKRPISNTEKFLMYTGVAAILGTCIFIGVKVYHIIK